MPYVGNTDDDRRTMLETIGLQSIDELFSDVPEAARFPELNVPEPLDEMHMLATLRRIAEDNRVPSASFLGAGAYDHYIPPAVDYLSGRGEFVTSYTPYQAEASQGTVQAIYEYQSLIAGLLSMEVVNASHYDGATAFAEAVLMAVRATRGRSVVVISGSVHPHYREVAETYCTPQGIEIRTPGIPDRPGASGPTAEELLDLAEDAACVAIQNPDFFGRLTDLNGFAEKVHDRGALLILHVDPIATALLSSPGRLGADIVTAEGQPLGIPISFGGPYLGIFATRRELVRKMPGRLAGETRDTLGRRGYVLTLNTREQHIRREKATSNICTNQGLMALRAAIYISLLGPEGMREVASVCHANTVRAIDRIASLPDCEVTGNGSEVFKEFVVRLPVDATAVVQHAAAHGVYAGVPLSTFYPERPDELLVACTEKTTPEQIDLLANALIKAIEAEKQK